jgi:hypothetical protein
VQAEQLRAHKAELLKRLEARLAKRVSVCKQHTVRWCAVVLAQLFRSVTPLPCCLCSPADCCPGAASKSMAEAADVESSTGSGSAGQGYPCTRYCRAQAGYLSACSAGSDQGTATCFLECCRCRMCFYTSVLLPIAHVLPAGLSLTCSVPPAAIVSLHDTQGSDSPSFRAPGHDAAHHLLLVSVFSSQQPSSSSRASGPAAASAAKCLTSLCTGQQPRAQLCWALSCQTSYASRPSP